MRGELILNRDKELLDVGVGLSGPLPGEVLAVLREQLCYTHMRRRTPRERKDPVTGEWLPQFAFEPKRLFLLDGRGRLVCRQGFAARIVREATGVGWACRRQAVQYPQMREGRFREDWDRLASRFEFRPRQDEAIAAMVASEDGGMLIAPPGWGKSFCYAALGLVYPDARIVVTTPSAAVARTNWDYLSVYLPDVGMVGDGHKDVRRVTVYVTASLVRCAGSVDCDILIGDEAHELGAATFAEAVGVAGRYARCYGGTASPEGRHDGSDIMLEGLFGPRLFEMGYQEAQALGLVVPIRVLWTDVSLSRNPVAGISRDDVRYRKGICQHHARNLIIAGIARMYGDDDQVLIMVDKVEHAMHLGMVLPEYQLCFRQIEADEERIWELAGLVDSSRINRTEAQREAIRKDFGAGRVRKVIATGVWSRGVSFNALSVLIRADAKASKIAATQIPGRVSRRDDASGKRFATVHDLRDLWDAGFKEAGRKRAKVYKDNGWVQGKLITGAAPAGAIT